MRRRGYISEVNLDALADICGGVTWPYPDQPPKDAAARRLLETLGVVGVPMIAAHTLAVTRDCVQPLCTDPALRGLDHCRRHAAIRDLRAGHQVAAVGEGRAALERMDAGEPQKRDTPPGISVHEKALAPVVEPETEDTRVDTKKAAPPPKWNRERILAGIKSRAAELGHQPSGTQAGAALKQAARKEFGSWADACVAAGFERPTKGFRGRVPVLAEREPKAAEERDTATPPTAEREPVRSAAVVSRPVTPAAVVADEPASRSANTEATLAEPDQDAGESRSEATPVTAYDASGSANVVPSDEGRKEEATLGELLAALAIALDRHRRALDFLSEISAAVKAHPDYQAAKDSEWL